MSLELFPQNVQLFPGQRQLFIARSRDLQPLWTRFTDGFVLPDRSVDYSDVSGGPSELLQALDSAQQLVGGIGYFEFTLDLQSTPIDPAVGSNGSFNWRACFGGPNGPSNWIYEVFINPVGVEIKDETTATIATLPHNVAIGDRFRVELNSGFRLFINDILRHERITGFTGGIHYPAFFRDVGIFQASNIGHLPRIPAPRLVGDWQPRPTDSLGNPVVLFTAPSHGSIAVSGLQAEYFNATIPGAYKIQAKIDAGVDVWVEDGPPTGSTVTSGGFSWVSSAPPLPFSGSLELRITNAAGTHQYVFEGATDTLQINPGDTLTCYVYPDAATPPTEIMLQWHTTDEAGVGFDHRAYWGANSIAFGTNGTNDRRQISASIPATGQWTRLEVPASLVGLEGLVVNGMAFTLFDGRCDFDQAGKYPNLQTAEALITIPPLQITGPLVRTIQPSSVTRFQTNYDVADVPPTWSVISGSGSFSGNEFTAPALAGMTVVRATAATGNQVADLTLNIAAVITPSFTFVGPSEVIDWDTDIPFKPSFVTAGTIAEGTGAVIPGLPAGIQPGDLLRLFVESANEAVATPSGYAVSADSPQGTGTGASTTATRLSIFWLRVPQSGIVSAPTVADPGEHVIAQIFAYRDCIASGNPWDVTAGNTGASGTAVSIPGDTTTVPNCLIEAAVSHQTDTATPQVSGYANSDLTNLTERTDVATTQGNGGGFAVVTGEKAVAGAYAATTATLANASVQGRISTALKPNPLVWTASLGSINSATGNWTAPAGVGQTAKITASNGVFSVTRDVLVLPIFPLNDPTLPLTWTRNRTSLISMSEDRKSRIVREKSGSFDDYEVKFTMRTLTESDAVDAFWDLQGLGKPFILEDRVRGIRKVGWFDSAINHEGYDTCAIDLSFRFLEASF